MTLRSLVAVAAFLCLFFLAALFAQEPPPKGSVEGVVVETGSGAPLPGAKVTLTLNPQRGAAAGPAGQIPPELANNPELAAAIARGQLDAARGRGRVVPIPPATTDENGRFTFANVEAGTYRMNVQANGHVPQEYGQRFVSGPGTPITLTAGQAKTDVSFSLIPAGNISGRLRDTAEQPLPNTAVQLLRPLYNANGTRSLQVTGGAVTDDRGEFRVYWVTPGRYYLRAGGPETSEAAIMMALGGGPTAGGNPNDVPVEVSAAFFPGVPDTVGARIVEVFPSGDVSGVDWALPPESPSRTVRGRLIDARTGKPPAQANVTITPVTTGLAAPNYRGIGLDYGYGYGYGLGGNRKYNPSTGAIEFTNVKPGVYEISATARDVPEGFGGGLRGPGGDVGFRGGDIGGPTVVSGSTTVAVSDADLNDVLLTVAPTGSLTGRVRFEGEAPAPPPTARELRGGVSPVSVQLVSTRQSTGPYGYGGSSVSGRPGQDGTFRMNNVAAGEYRVQAQMPANAYVKSAQLNGVNVLDSPLVVAGIAAGNLEVVVSYNSGKVQGSLLDERADPSPVTQVVLVPDRSRGRPDLYKMVVTDSDGHFTINGVAPGDYKLFAWRSIDPYGWFDPEVIERSESRGSPVHVSESSVENVVVKIVPAGGAQ